MVAAKRETATQPKGAGSGTPAEGGEARRKPWIKKTPVEIILEQVAKQEEQVAELRKELAKEEGELKKMQDATKLLQAK